LLSENPNGEVIMELRQLKTFLTVSQLLSFNRAAGSLNYAQSTVSAQIKALEDELAVPLFDRLGKRVVLTEAGDLLARYARKMLDMEAATISTELKRLVRNKPIVDLWIGSVRCHGFIKGIEVLFFVAASPVHGGA
jgi:DNA-binding transcriptional LysR family regulator